MNRNNFKMAAKKKVLLKKKAPPAKIEKEPDYMVQIAEPKMVRKDLLESLREVIIFMQGYEKFKKVQEDKVALFTTLKSDVKELNMLIEGQLKKYLPKGKLRVSHAVFQGKKENVTENNVEILPAEKTQSKPQRTYQEERLPEQATVSRNELEELESQLQDIENQLRNIK